jgi:hypothetical protein
MKEQLQEIKRGQTGTGLLLECEDYNFINADETRESLKKYLREASGKPTDNGNPFIFPAIFQKYGVENANGRIYTESVLKKEVERFQYKIATNQSYGELNHPLNSSIDGGRISHNIIELKWEGATLVGKLQLIVSKSYVNSGIICCVGDTVAQLIVDYGLKIGVSSRGVGSVESKMGKLVVQDDYDLICWDIVTDPSTPGAYIGKQFNDIKTYVENKDIKSQLILDKLDKIIIL